VVDPVNKKLSERPVSADVDAIADYLNRELAPVVKRTRLTLDALLARILEGEGSPEGVVVADRSAIYMNQTGAPGSFLWCKTTDGVATGWVAVF
jgi:hypothetical protein